MTVFSRILALTLGLLLLLTGCALAEDASIQAILNKGTLILGLDDSFPPMGYRNEDNEIVGFDIDLANEVAARMGVKLVPQPVDWASKELELASGNIDCIWNGMSITPDRQESMAMTFSYLNNQMEFYALKDGGIKALEDLTGKKIAVQGGSYAEELLNGEKYAELSAGFDEIISFEDYLTALMDLQTGGVDAVLIDKVVAEYRIAGMGAQNIIAIASIEDDNYGIGFRREDTALRDKVQGILIEMAKDGSLAEISTRWFGTDISTVPVQ